MPITADRRPIYEEATLDELVHDPNPFYAEWRRSRPIGFLPLLDSWLVTRWDDCETIGKDDVRVDTFNQFSEDFLGTNLLTMQGDPHRWLRQAADAPLRPKAVASYVEALTRPAARAYLDAVKDRGRTDALTGILEPISVRVVGDVLGIADVDDETRQRWFQELFSVAPTADPDGEAARRAAATRDEVDAYFRDAVARITARPDDSALSSLVHANTPDGQPRTFAELRGTILLFVMGGFREPGHGATSTLLGLLSHPEQAGAVAADPSLIPAAITEGLRWLPPFAMTQRRAIADLDIGDVTIPAGDEINLVLGSAGRDERRYDRPEVFDLGRPRQPVVAFGFGAHYCAGHFLAREIERIVLEEVFRTLPNLRLDPDEEPVVRGFTNRAAQSLPVVWDAP